MVAIIPRQAHDFEPYHIMKSIEISVIIPCRNRIEMAAEALDSVFAQKIPSNYNLQVIVVDNMSKPPAKRLLGKRFPQVKFIENNRKANPGATRNIGLKHASGKYIAFLDSDDIWKSDFLSTSIHALRGSGSAATVCLTEPFFYGPYPLGQKLSFLFLNIVKTTALYGSYFLNSKKIPLSGFYLCQFSHMLFIGEEVRKIKFNENVVAAGDWQFIVGATKNKPIRIILRPLVRFRYVMKSITNTKRALKTKWETYLDLLERIPNSHKKGLLSFLFRSYIWVFQMLHSVYNK